MNDLIGLEEMKNVFGLEFDASGKISQFGGIGTFIQYLKKSQIKERLEKILGKNEARSFLQLMLAIIVGAEDMEDVSRVGQDPLIKKYLVKPVSETQIARNYKSLEASTIEKLHDFAISLAILDICSFIDKDRTITIDVDSTSKIKYGHQEGVEYGYVGNNDETEKCYQYLFFRLSELHSFLYGTLRSGSTHSQNGFNEYLERFLPLFKGTRRIKLRCDSGFFNHNSFDVCYANNTLLYVKAPMSESRRNQASSSHLVWITDNEDPLVSYASYTNYTAKNTVWREVFKRTELKDSGSLFRDFRYDCVATNDMGLAEDVVFSFYNGRANIENNIRELKNDYGLGKIITSSFGANDAITQTIMVAYILVQHFKRISLEDSDQKMQLGTLRWRLFNIPGRRIRSGRKIWFRIVNAFASAAIYQAVLSRIKLTKSVLVNPPLEFLNAAI